MLNNKVEPNAHDRRFMIPLCEDSTCRSKTDRIYSYKIKTILPAFFER